jgi:small-conductance mechanosensitive channel
MEEEESEEEEQQDVEEQNKEQQDEEQEDKGKQEDEEKEDEGQKYEKEKREVKQEYDLDESVKTEVQKKLLSLLNKLSDGNMDIIFKDLYEVLQKYAAHPEPLARIYFKVFQGFCIDSQMLNSSILSVNCLMLTAFQRLLGQNFFAPIIDSLISCFKTSHIEVHSSTDGSLSAQIRLKNITSIITHFYLFESITHTLISDVIKFLLKSFKEKDIEMLLNLLHNIGAMLRKDSPSL